MSTENLQMSEFRKSVFPITNEELKKFVPFALLIFITVFNFTQLRNIKDNVVLTAPGSGSEAISYLKTFMVMPAVITMGAVYVRLRKAMSFERTYVSIVSFFLVFFAVWNFVLYPNADILHWDLDRINQLKADWPRIKAVFPVIGAWTYSLYYLMAEMWGTYVLSVLFWQFANQNVSTEEAKRFYPPFLFVNAMATVCVGLAMKVSGGIVQTNIVVIVSGLMMLYIFRHINKEVLTDPRFANATPKKKKSKVKLSFFDSMAHLVHSPYIGYLSLMILAYGFSINLLEVYWKKVASTLNPSQEDFYNMMTNYSIYTGLLGMFLAIVGRWVIRRFGWLACALVTPVVIISACTIYFSALLFDTTVQPAFLAIMGLADPSMFFFTFGMIGVIVSKSSKYSFFDPTKEMAYIPLEPDLRMTGKAAADGVGGRLGKAGSGWFQMFMFAVTAGGLAEIVPYVSVLLFILSGLWIFSVYKLHGLYQKELIQSEIRQKEAEAEAA
ncbi:MAG: Npt1/Npt2 family nucleotide transporter [Pseudomonadota bacterium]|nr:Npt1/Npt2 family nucleotide transporter [Pseudomonadota bacterium]